MRVAVLVSAALLAQSSAVVADDGKAPLVLEPSAPWHVNYANDSCRLARIFGEGESKAAVYLERYEPGDSFFLVAAGKRLAGRDKLNSRFEFGPGGMVVEDGEQVGDMAEFGPAIMSGMTLLPTSQDERGERRTKRYDPNEEAQNTEIFEQELTADQEAAIEWLEVRRGKLPAVRFMLGSMRKPMAAMRACTDELMTHWGIDLDAHRNLTRAAAPESNPGDWIDSGDYPRDLLRKGAQGLVQFRLSVSAEGMPTQCHIQQSTRPEGFDKAVCETLMRRARFEPALGADGQPIASFWRSAVRFMMPD